MELMLLDDRGAVLAAGETALTLIGLPKHSEFKGRPLSAMLGQTHALLPIVDAAISSDAEAREVTIRAGDDNGTEQRTVIVSLFRLRTGRKKTGFLITLRQKDPQESATDRIPESKGPAEQAAWISDAAHHLRSPLHGMNMRLELLKREVGDSPAQRHIEKLHTQVQRLDQAVEDLLRACGRRI